MQVAVPLFPRMTALDAIGPYEVLQRVPDIDVVFVGERRGEVRTENGMLGLSVDATFADIPSPDVVVVPGGIGSRALLAGGPLVDWVRAAHPGTRFTTSVCSGALVLGAAGLLDGLTATTHWGRSTCWPGSARRP
ncbi:DJ-1/PfpI family protein [Pseudonocardia benzenivorans]